MSFKKSKVRTFSFDLDDPFQCELLTALSLMPRGNGLAAILNVLRKQWGGDTKALQLTKKMKEVLYNQNIPEDDAKGHETADVKVNKAPTRTDFSRLKIS